MAKSRVKKLITILSNIRLKAVVGLSQDEDFVTTGVFVTNSLGGGEKRFLTYLSQGDDSVDFVLLDPTQKIKPMRINLYSVALVAAGVFQKGHGHFAQRYPTSPLEFWNQNISHMYGGQVQINIIQSPLDLTTEEI